MKRLGKVVLSLGAIASLFAFASCKGNNETNKDDENGGSNLGKTVDPINYSLSSTSYEVGILNVGGVTSCPTWTVNNGQDEIVWHSAIMDGSRKFNGSGYFCTVNKYEHKNESGTYATHFYSSQLYEGGTTWTW